MKKYDSVIIGHLSLDHNTDHLGKKIVQCGGAVLFASASAKSLGHKVAAVTKLAKKDLKRADEFTINRDDIYIRDSEKSTEMENIYFTPDKERRKCSCLSQGDPFKTSDVPADIEADVYQFAGLTYGDYPNEMIKDISKRGKIALDVQTCLRHVNKNSGDMFFEDWEYKKEMLPYVTYLKTDAAEAEIMTNTDDRAKAAEILFGLGAKEILITHNTEVLAYDGKNIFTCPIRARNLSGRTGRGDTTFGAYINERINEDIKTSLLYATATVSLKMEKPGPINCTRADIQNYINEFYRDFI